MALLITTSSAAVKHVQNPANDLVTTDWAEGKRVDAIGLGDNPEVFGFQFSHSPITIGILLARQGGKFPDGLYVLALPWNLEINDQQITLS